jgi:heme-degrading monooxygenase HmoA
MAEPPCVAVIFSSTRTTDDTEGYGAMADRMEALATRQDGFLGLQSVRDTGTGEGITVSYWSDEAAARAWRGVAEHVAAQELGRTRWYARYEIVVATVTRRYGSDAPAG